MSRQHGLRIGLLIALLTLLLTTPAAVPSAEAALPIEVPELTRQSTAPQEYASGQSLATPLPPLTAHTSVYSELVTDTTGPNGALQQGTADSTLTVQDATFGWAWMSGADTVNQAGVYGTRGVPAPGNVPGAREGSISWIDSAGNLWLMGGYGYDRDGSEGDLNDLWRYDGNGRWTWLSGSNTHSQHGVYGTRGVPALGNVPGAREGSISWIDSAGNLWLMGGWGYDSTDSLGSLNDLWRYDGNGRWTWLSGANTRNQAGVHGTQGVPAPGNVPGAREGSISWIDSAGNLWLLGGYGYDRDGSLGRLNDLWCYDEDRQWTWMSGADTRSQAGVYGTRGVPAPGNVPGARQDSISWIDSAGNLWLLGGYGYDSAGSEGYLNDLWRYDTDGQWTWLSGANTRNQAGVYGTKGIPTPGNIPGARYNSISWIDSAGNLWLFGGLGYDGAGSSGRLNDLWRYGTNGRWTWMSGASTVNQAGVYGTQGVPAPGNVPGARYNSISWIDSAGNLWLFGGYGYDSGGNSGRLNDLWRYGYRQPTLTLVKSVTPTTGAPYHGVVTYTVVLSNTGVESDPAVLLTDTLPASVTFGQWVQQPAAGDLIRVGNAITWTGEIAAQTALTFTFTAIHTSEYGDVVTNIAHFSGTLQRGNAAAIFSVEIIAPPGAPTLNAIDNTDGDGNYTVSWSSVSGATGYTLQEAANGDFTGATTAYSGSGISTAFSSKASGTYYYRVRATITGGNSAWSNIRSVVLPLRTVYLPLTLRDYVTYFEGPWEVEPNDTWQQANGPLVSGRTYYGKFPSAADAQDYFSIYLRSSQSVELWLSNIGAGHNYDLILRNAALSEVGYSGNLDNANEHIRTPILPAGWYYIQVYNRGGTGSTQPYNLRVVHPAAALTAAESELPAPASLSTPEPPEP